MATKTQVASTGRASKGNVSVEAFQNRLRLRFRVNGKQKAFSLGLADSPENRKLAELKARQIELDIISGNFDCTLQKYKLQTQVAVQQKVDQRVTITISELFKDFIDINAKDVYSRTLEKYQATLNYLNEFQCQDGMNQKCLGDKPAYFLSDTCAEQFTAWLRDKNSERVLKERLGLLNACWEWAMKKQIVEYNPWKNLQKRIRVAPKQSPKPFTKDEVQAIIEAFKNEPHYKHYASYVQFLFSTGVRTGEAIGLCWKHISDDFSTIWIGESLTKGVRKSTKTNKARTIPVSSNLKNLLESIKLENVNPDAPVFVTRQGNPLDEHNFSRRAWQTILTRLGIPYRRPYNTRHTFISHCLEAGLNPVAVASITGHDVKVLYQNYVGLVSSSSLPELF